MKQLTEWHPPEPKKPWYAPRELLALRASNRNHHGVSGNDAREQILFVLSHLTESCWPRRAVVYQNETGAVLNQDGVPIGIQKSRSTKMPNQEWIEVISELRRRIDMAGDDGNIVYLVHENGVDFDTMATALRCSENDLIRRYWRVINWVSTGKFNNRPSYVDWCNSFKRRAVKAARNRWKENY